MITDSKVEKSIRIYELPKIDKSEIEVMCVFWRLMIYWRLPLCDIYVGCLYRYEIVDTMVFHKTTKRRVQNVGLSQKQGPEGKNNGRGRVRQPAAESAGVPKPSICVIVRNVDVLRDWNLANGRDVMCELDWLCVLMSRKNSVIGYDRSKRNTGEAGKPTSRWFEGLFNVVHSLFMKNYGERSAVRVLDPEDSEVPTPTNEQRSRLVVLSIICGDIYCWKKKLLGIDISNF